MFPNEIRKKIIKYADSADVLCQLAGVNKSFYMNIHKDFKRLCFNNLIYRLPGELWSAAFSQAIDRVWTERWSDNPRIRWCKESGRIAFFLGHRVMIINLDFSRPFCRWITLEDRAMHADLSNKGRYLCVAMVAENMIYKTCYQPEIIVYSTQTGKIVTKKKVSRVDWVPGKLVGVLNEEGNRRLFFNTDTLETHGCDLGFWRPYQSWEDRYKTNEHHYIVTVDHNNRDVYVTDIMQGDMYTIRGRYTINTQFVFLTVTDTLIIHYKNTIDFYDLKAKKVVMTFRRRDYGFWKAINKNIMVLSDTDKVVVVNDKTRHFELLPITFSELLTKDGITYIRDTLPNYNLEELMYVCEGTRTVPSYRNQLNTRLVFTDVEKCNVTIKWFDQRPSTTSHPFHTILKHFEKQTLIKDGAVCPMIRKWERPGWNSMTSRPGQTTSVQTPMRFPNQ